MTVMTPILPGADEELRRVLDSLPVGPQSPLARLGRTHFGRWVIIPGLVHERAPQPRDELRSPYLLFSAVFDGRPGPYLEGLCDCLAGEAHAIWNRCAGYPGHPSRHRAAFMAYLRAHEIHATAFLAAYPEATVAHVRESLAFRRRFVGFVSELQGARVAQARFAAFAEQEAARR